MADTTVSNVQRLRASRRMDVPSRFVVPLESSLEERLPWLVTLRWIAGSMVLLGGGISLVYDFGVDGSMIALIGCVILLYNIPFRILHWRCSLKFHWLCSRHSLIANVQVGLDWMCLLLLAHLTGGVGSPLLIVFMFHIILVAILLSAFNAYAHAVLATTAVAALGILEAYGFLPHNQPVWAPYAAPTGLHLITSVLSFAVGAIVTAFLVVSIVRHLREAENEQVELERGLAKALRELEQANAELVEMDEQKTRYTRTVTHQLRSPMSAIQSLLRVLLDGYAGEIDEAARTTIQKADRRTVQLLDTVGDLLNLAGMDFGKKPKEAEPVTVSEVVDVVTAKYAPFAQERNVTVQIDVLQDLTVMSVRDDIELVFDNLVSNAIKYSRPETDVIVKGWTGPEHVHLSVEDHGIGIPEASQKQLFTEFYRAPNAKKHEAHGTGLGLSIVKRSIERWGGTIHVVSAEGEGTTFFVEFPVPKSDHTASPV